MGLDGFRAQVEAVGDLLVRQALADQQRDVLFPLGQPLERVRAVVHQDAQFGGALVGELPVGVRADHDEPLAGGAQRPFRRGTPPGLVMAPGSDQADAPGLQRQPDHLGQAACPFALGLGAVLVTAGHRDLRRDPGRAHQGGPAAGARGGGGEPAERLGRLAGPAELGQGLRPGRAEQS